MADQNRFEFLGVIPSQRCANPLRVQRRMQAEINHVHLDPKRLRHLAPANTKAPCCNAEHPLAGRNNIAQSRLPGAMTIGDIHRDLTLGACHPAQIRNQPMGQLNQSPLINIGGGPMHRLQNPIWHNGRAGERQIRPAL